MGNQTRAESWEDKKDSGDSGEEEGVDEMEVGNDRNKMVGQERGTELEVVKQRDGAQGRVKTAPGH